MKNKITKISATKQKISGRGGISFFLRYVENTGFYKLTAFGFLNINIFSHKGLQLFQFIKQMLAFFIDGTDMTMTSFDKRKEDGAYTALLENNKEEMASSHQVKRFFGKFVIVPDIVFRKILRKLFIWRLLIEKPKIIELFVDTMVLNNNDAIKREGCEPTYKPVKGFQPLHITWGRFFVDVLFRKGSAHSNHGTDYTDTVREIVKLIRKGYQKDVPIIIKNDSGFFDQKAFEIFEEELGIIYVTAGSYYGDTKPHINGLKQANLEIMDQKREHPADNKDSKLLFNEFKTGDTLWQYIEFGSCLQSWTKFRRCIYTQQASDENGQLLLDFHKSDNLIYTNIGNDPALNQQLKTAGYGKYLQAEEIIKLSHSKGKDELIHRSIKDFATKEQLPFKKFYKNAAYYYIMIIAHFLFEAYKTDVTSEVVPIKSYPTTFRRKLIDFAVKIVSHGRQIILQVNRDTCNNLNIRDIWARCQKPPVILQIE